MRAIVGESMIKDVYDWELSDREERRDVKYFSGSTKEDVKTYIQPPLKRDPDRVMIHVDTNDLRSTITHKIFKTNSCFHVK